MAVTCAKCGAENPKTNRFCDSCGEKLSPSAVEETAAAKPARGKAVAKAVEAPPARVKRASEEALPEPALAPAAGLPASLWWLIAIVGLGAFLRLWGLGDKPLHHDESIHAWYAFKLFQGDVYRYDPAYHGPFRYHMNALLFFIFGVSDFTVRLLPAIIGISGLAFMWQWRGLLGKRGAIYAAAIMAISPTWVYNSRFIRDDVTMAVGELILIWGLFKHFETGARKYLLWGAAGLMMSFTSHEGTWIFLGIIGSFLFIRWLWEKAENVQGEHADLSNLVDRLALPLVAPRADMVGGAAALFVWLVGYISKAWNGIGPLGIFLGLLVSYAVFALGVRALFYAKPEARKIWLGLLLVFFVPFTVLYSTVFNNMDGWFIGAFDSIAYWLGEQKTGRADQPWQFYLYMLSLYELAICAFALFGGLRLYFSSGKRSFFLLKILAFLPFAFAILILTRYPKDPRMVPVMSLLAVFGGGLAAWSSFEDKAGSHFRVFLLYWSMLALIMFTIAGERMPWLTLHPLTPLTLLAALYLDDFFSRSEARFSEHWLAWGIIALPLAILVVFVPRTILQALIHAPEEIVAWIRAFGTGGRHGSFQPSGWALSAWQNKGLYYAAGAVFVTLLAAVPLGLLQRWTALKGWTRGIFIGLALAGLATLSHGTLNLIFHGDGADPREQHVYVQSSVELVELTAKLERMSRALTGGPYLKVAVEDLCSWPMSWYLRDMEKAQIGFAPPLKAEQVQDFPVVMTGYDNLGVPNHDQIVADSFSNSYSAYPVRFRRWWAPDKSAFYQGSFKDQATRAWKLFAYREPWMPGNPIRNPQFENYIYPKGDSVASPYGSFDACVWIRKDVEKFFQ